MDGKHMARYSNEKIRRCIDAIQKASEKLLQMSPDPVPAYLLMRDGLDRGVSDNDLQRAKRMIHSSRWIQQLKETQLPDGTWGRFHTQNTKIRQPIPTTEVAISLSLDSGLDKNDKVLLKTVQFIENHIDGKTTWSDNPEKHDNPDAWYVTIPFLSAANLALIDNEHGKLGTFRDSWREIASVAFKSGVYDRNAEIEASNRILKCRTKNHLRFHTKYPLILLSSTRDPIDLKLETLILDYVMSNPDGVYYLYGRKLSEMPRVSGKGFYLWLKSQMILSRFPIWYRYAEQFVPHILDQQNDDGLWCFSECKTRRPLSSLPLSESWRRKENKAIDCTVMTLQLLRRYQDQVLRAA
jgi:hypothetical protein